MGFSYKLYGEAQTDLVKRIKDINDSLVLLARLIAHGKQFEPEDGLSIADFKASIINQIYALSEMIKAREYGLQIDHLEITDRIAQFSAESLQLIASLERLSALPSLKSEEQQLEDSINNFDEFAENLSQDPIRPEVLQALKKTEELQAQVNHQIELARENPLVAIAECWFEGAVAVNSLSGPELKRPTHPR